MQEKQEVKDLLVMAIYAGKIMLSSGAETYRVEDTVIRLCKSHKSINFAEAFVTPTGIFLSVEYKDEVMSYIKRIKNIQIDLNKIALVNEFSRKFVNNTMSLQEGMDYLELINEVKSYSPFIKYLSGGVAGGFFSVLFGGGLLEFIYAFIVSLIVVFTINILSRFEFTYFLNNIIGSTIATILSIILVNVGFGGDMNMIIIGSIMPLVPGVAITNAIRDSISGDLLSGLSRGMEAIIIALSIAFGVGIILRLYFILYGGI